MNRVFCQQNRKLKTNSVFLDLAFLLRNQAFLSDNRDSDFISYFVCVCV